MSLWAKRLPVDSRWVRYLGTATIMAICTFGVMDLSGQGLRETNVAMVYILGVTFSATIFGRGPGIMASVVGVVAFDFFYTRPHYNLAVEDTEYLVTLAVMLVITMIISDLTVRLRSAAQSAELREHRTHILYEFSKALAGAEDLTELLQTVRTQADRLLKARIGVWLRKGDNQLAAVLPWEGPGDDSPPDPALWARMLEDQSIGGNSTPQMTPSARLLIPLIGGREAVLGILGIRLQGAPTRLEANQQQVLETLARQVALAIERHQLHDATKEALLQVEMERTRSSLLSSVSHDLRTPLASIAGASSTLMDEAHHHDRATVHQLLGTIYDEAQRLIKLIDNLLSMARIESGNLAVRKEWQPVEEVVGSALRRLDEALCDREVHVSLPPGDTLVPLDGVLIEQVLINLLENAVKYSPAGSPIEIEATPGKGQLSIAVADSGPGIPPEFTGKIFEKFFRAKPHSPHHTGLGLAICKAIIEAHGGTISAANRSAGGSIFRFSLPVEGEAPGLPADWEGMQDDE